MKHPGYPECREVPLLFYCKRGKKAFFRTMLGDRVMIKGLTCKLKKNEQYLLSDLTSKLLSEVTI